MSAYYKKPDSAVAPTVFDNFDSEKLTLGKEAWSKISKTPDEWQAEWSSLVDAWHNAYRPIPGSLAATYVLEVIEAEWQCIRLQYEYDYFLCFTCDNPLSLLPLKFLKASDHLKRRMTAAGNEFERRRSILDYHYGVYKLSIFELKKDPPVKKLFAPSADPTKSPRPS